MTKIAKSSCSASITAAMSIGPVADERSRFGLRSGRYQVRYVGPDRQSHKAPVTFSSKGDAETFLATVRADIARSTWQPPTRQPDRVPTLDEYADEWLSSRSRELKPRTTALYRGLLDGHLLPTLGSRRLDEISPATVRLALPTGHRAHPPGARLQPAADDPQHRCVRRRDPGQPLSTPRSWPVATGQGHPPGHLERAGRVGWGYARTPPADRALGGMVRLAIRGTGGVAPQRRRHQEGRAACPPRRHLGRRQAGDRDPQVGRRYPGRHDTTPPGSSSRRAPTSAAGKGRDGLLFTAVDGVSLLTHDMLKRPFDRARKAAGRPDLRFHDLRH